MVIVLWRSSCLLLYFDCIRSAQALTIEPYIWTRSVLASCDMFLLMMTHRLRMLYLQVQRLLGHRIAHSYTSS
jgi:hypothetical protein